MDTYQKCHELLFSFSTMFNKFILKPCICLLYCDYILQKTTCPSSTAVKCKKVRLATSKQNKVNLFTATPKENVSSWLFGKLKLSELHLTLLYTQRHTSKVTSESKQAIGTIY